MAGRARPEGPAGPVAAPRAGRARAARIAAALVALAGGIAGGRGETPAPPAPAAVADVPRALSLGMLGPAPDAFRPPAAAPPSAAPPDLGARAGAALGGFDGRWTDGTNRLHIDARRRVGRLQRERDLPLQPVVVRDVGAAMIVADIGPQRFVLIRRPDGVAVAGATLAAPLELRREEPPRDRRTPPAGSAPRHEGVIARPAPP